MHLRLQNNLDSIALDIRAKTANSITPYKKQIIKRTLSPKGELASNITSHIYYRNKAIKIDKDNTKSN